MPGRYWRRGGPEHARRHLRRLRGRAVVTLVERLAGELCGPLDASELDAARRHLFDGLVAAVVGRRAPEAARLRGVMAGRLGQPGPPTGWAGLPRLGVADGAAALCRLIRTTETDDLQLASCTTPAAVVVPAALAAASLAPRQDARRMLSAIAGGYHVVYRLGLAIGGPDHLFGGGWPTLAVASAGAAATAATLLDAGQADRAAALALGVAAAPRLRPRPEPARLFALGAAVATGLEAAIAAVAGADGDLGVLDEAAGAGTGGFALDLLEREAPAGSGLAAARFKRFCSAGQAAGAIEAAGRLVSLHDLDPREVTRVIVEVPPAYATMIDQPLADGRIASMLSVQHGIALRLAMPAGLFDCARATPCAALEVRSLMGIVEVRPAPDLDAGYPERWPARVTVEAGGRSRTLEVDGPGDAGWDELVAKASRLAEVTGARLDAAALGDAVASFASTDELFDALASSTAGASETGHGNGHSDGRRDHRVFSAPAIGEPRQGDPVYARAQARAAQ